jgi:hypothetical protein
MDIPEAGNIRNSLARPKRLEAEMDVGFWATSIEVEKDLRKRDYGWVDVGGAYLSIHKFSKSDSLH